MKETVDIIRDLRSVEHEYSNRFVSTGQVNISHMARDCADTIESLTAQLAQKDSELAEVKNDYDILSSANTELFGALAQKEKELSNARNELCYKCGRYAEAHNGACDSCKWREK